MLMGLLIGLAFNFANADAREPLANVGRYDALRNREARHAS